MQIIRDYIRKGNLIDNKVFNGSLLIILFVLFASAYITSVISPQFGWWHYYAWRMEEGDILYKDMYLFIPPYFVFFTNFLYHFFGSHFFYYTLFVGFPVKLACILIMYSMVCKITRPFYACLSVFCGACLSSIYNMDMWYDYNPIVMLPCVLTAYLSVRYYENLKKGNLSKSLVFWIGFLISIIFCFKQTFGISFLFAVVLMIFVIYQKEYIGRLRRFVISIIPFVCGFLIALFPVIIYMTYNNCWNDFFYCLLSVGEAKGGVMHILTRCFLVFNDFKIWVYIVVLFVLWKIYIHYGPQDHTNYIKEKNINILVLSIAALFIIAIIVYINASVDFHGAINSNVLVNKWRVRLYRLLVYSGVIVWISMIIQYFFNIRNLDAILVFTTLIVAHFFTGILSTDFLEELYLLLYAPWMLAFALKVRCPFNWIKNTLVLCIIFTISLTCISTKRDIPYSWQGWTTPAISNQRMFSTVYGLEWQTMSASMNDEFLKITNLINKYCSASEDKVFQFSNIPLFNVLTRKEIPSYVPITWFDVCPDTLAELVSRQLYEERPKMVVWNNMDRNNWDILERVFRDGKKSGQRQILKFYNDVIKSEYKKVYSIDNNRDGKLELWLKKQ